MTAVCEEALRFYYDEFHTRQARYRYSPSPTYRPQEGYTPRRVTKRHLPTPPGAPVQEREKKERE